MKIEKINDNQIRCTLSHQDLVDRELKLSELAYGTEKAKALFHDMMQQASFEFGFEADNIPIMIEAIPVSRETLILIITKVDNPDELDTRFSKFSTDGNMNNNSLLSRFNELAELFDDDNDDAESETDDEQALYEDDFEEDIPEKESHITQETAAFESDIHGAVSQQPAQTSAIQDPSHNTALFAFSSLDDVMKFARIVHGRYCVKSTLYKDNKTNTFYLMINRSDQSPGEFAKICNSASEYGLIVRSQYMTVSHFNEHFEVFIEENAIEIMASI